MTNIINITAQKINIKPNQVQVVLDLFEEGATVPFISRYRKEQTGGLNEEVVANIHTVYKYQLELNKRKEAIIKILQEADLLSDDLKLQIEKCDTKIKLESLYEPYKEGKKTKASEAIALGLLPLAKTILEASDPQFNPFAEARKYISEKVSTADFAIEQSKLIIAQLISQDLDTRQFIKDSIYKFGSIKTNLKKNAVDEKEVFKNYYDAEEKIARVANHRILAMNRGEDQKILSISFIYSKDKIKYDVNNKFFRIKTTGKIIHDSIADALERLIYPSIEREIWKELFEKAESSSIDLFAKNLEHMLLAPAIKNKIVMAIDPAFYSGCKVAVLSKNCDLLKIEIIYPNPPKSDYKRSKETILRLIKDFDVDIIVIGNGTASRETETFIGKVIGEEKLDIKFSIVSEVGASVYSASKLASDEFPSLSVEQRSAISIGRRFQDPLNELVKIEPKSIGVGQYQHDVTQKKLSDALDFRVQKVVNMVGVDANTATKEILSHISGLTPSIAQKIIDYRRDNGFIKSRTQIAYIKGIGEKTYEQAIGFIRIHDSDNYFDKTNIHPESYGKARKILAYLGIDEDSDISKSQLIQNADVKKLSNELNIDFYTVEQIINSLKEVGKDIRDQNDQIMLFDKIRKIDDLKIGDVVEGQVQNITDFGAFVYFGIKESALIHVSKMSNKRIGHPSEVLSIGQKVKMEIIGLDVEKGKVQGKLIRD